MTMKGVALLLRAVVHIKPHRKAPLALFRQATAYRRKPGGNPADEASKLLCVRGFFKKETIKRGMVRTLPSSYSTQRRSGYPGEGWCHGGASGDAASQYMQPETEQSSSVNQDVPLQDINKQYKGTKINTKVNFPQ